LANTLGFVDELYKPAGSAEKRFDSPLAAAFPDAVPVLR
jgi:hypothetical protein